MSALEEWIAAVCRELGLEGDFDLRGGLGAVLGLARDVAHGVDRPAAPVTAYLVGLAAGRSADPNTALDELAAKVRALIPAPLPTRDRTS